MEKSMRPIIDFHVHLFPDKGFDAIWKIFENAYGMKLKYKFYYKECIEHLNSRGVDYIVFSNYAHKKGFAEPMNRWNLQVLDEFEKLYCFTPYHPDDDNSLEYTKRMLSHPRVVGVKMHLQIQRFYPHDERLFPLYEMIMDRGKRILLHVGNGPEGNQYVGYKGFLKLLKRYPDLPVNIPHMGGLEFKEFMNILDDNARLYLDTAYSFWPGMPFTFNLGPEYLEKYKDRIVYGSDFPNVILPREGEIEGLLKLGLSEEFYDKVFFTNGMKLLSETCGA